MPVRTPSFTGSYWVGHGALAARLAKLLFAGRVTEALQLASDERVELLNLFTAFKFNLNAAGYNDDGTLAGPVAPPPSGLSSIVLSPWRQTMADANGAIVVQGEFDNTTGHWNRRRVPCAAGKTYSVAFTVLAPNSAGNYLDASPGVRASIAIEPAGSGNAMMTVTAQPEGIFLPPGAGAAGGVANVGFWGTDLPPLYGKTLYANFLTGVDTDVFLEILLPTPGTRTANT